MAVTDNQRKPARRIDEAAIIDAALRFVRRSGMEKLGMRPLARELGVSPMALYHHVPSKEALLERMRDEVLARIELPEPSAKRWRAQMREYALAAVTELSKYPDLLKPGSGSPPTAAMRRMTQHGIEILLAAGFAPRDAAFAITTYHTQIFGMTMLRIQLDLRARDRKPPRSRKAGPSEVRAQMRSIGFDEALSRSVDTVLDGLAAQLARQRRKR